MSAMRAAGWLLILLERVVINDDSSSCGTYVK